MNLSLESPPTCRTSMIETSSDDRETEVVQYNFIIQPNLS